MERMELMYETNQMDEATYRAIPAVIGNIEQRLGVTITEENAGACMSHLAKAIQRVKEGAPVQECSDVLLAQMKEEKELFALALEILAPYNEAHKADLSAEAAFIASYFAMLTEEETV